MREANSRICRIFISGALLLVLFLAGGCATFEHDWKQAARQPATTDDLQGRWQGTWASGVTGHTDQLRCVITEKGDGTYQARFHAKYHKALSFGYTVPLKVERSGVIVPKVPLIPGYSTPFKVDEAAGTFRFSGEANLGWMAGGLYQYEGEADGTNFFSTYRCKYDHGTFQMTRPAE